MFPRSDRDRDGSPAQTALTLSEVAAPTGPDATPPDPSDPGARAHRPSRLTQPLERRAGRDRREGPEYVPQDPADARPPIPIRRVDAAERRSDLERRVAPETELERRAAWGDR
jgi:hypothetical protein